MLLRLISQRKNSKRDRWIVTMFFFMMTVERDEFNINNLEFRNEFPMDVIS